MRTQRGALEWAHAHHSDFVVLQPHSHWYNTQQSTTANARQSAIATAGVARQLGGLPVVPVGEAFERARMTAGAPSLFMPDRRRPSAAGTYLAALVFYHYLTGRTGAEATYRPAGMSRDTALLLARLGVG